MTPTAGLAPRLVPAFDHPFADSTAPDLVPLELTAARERPFCSAATSSPPGYDRHRGALLAERLGWTRLGPPALLDRSPTPARSETGTRGAAHQRFARAAELPFQDRYFETLSQLSRARGSRSSPQASGSISPRRPRTHFQRGSTRAGAHRSPRRYPT